MPFTGKGAGRTLPRFPLEPEGTKVVPQRSAFAPAAGWRGLLCETGFGGRCERSFKPIKIV